jgi:diacylglycerol kinase family enzyme
MLPTKHAGHAVELAYNFARTHRNPLIISASGDGGYNEVVNGALQAQSEGAQPICAVLPSGNANDHARTMQDKPLVDLIVQNEVTELDVLGVTARAADGVAVQRYAHSYVGIGLTPTVAVELNKQTLNSLRETWIVTKTFRNYRPVVIRAEGKKLQIDSLIFSTIPEMAKVLSFSEKSRPRDGLFEVTMFRHNHKLKLILRLAKGVFKHLGAQRRTDRFVFTVMSPTPMQLDGEVMQLTKGSEVTVAIHPRLLRTVALV